MTNLVIRRSGTLIDVSTASGEVLPRPVQQLLGERLSYTYKRLLRGHAQYGPDGSRRTVEFERRQMYAMEQGRLVTGFGFLTTVVELLEREGYSYTYQDISPAKPEGVYTPDWENVARHIRFRPRQEDCLRAIAGNQCGLINAAMGFGKTHLIEAICHLYPRARIDILARPKDVVARMVRQLSRTLPNVGQIGGGRKFGGERITIYTAGSAHHAANSSADFLLADEVHQLMTDTTTRTMGECWRYTRNFGFTATPTGRLDGADAQLELFFGREIFRLTYPEAVELGLVVPIRVRWIPVRMTSNPVNGMDGVRRMRWGVWRNDERNGIIARDIRENYPDPDTQILILVATVEHAIRLWQFLPEFSLCYGSLSEEDMARYRRAGLLPEGFIPTTAERREEMRAAFEAGTLKRVIATDVWATGVDFEALQVLYRADARESEILDSQGPGRVSRVSPETGKEYGEVVDCLDLFDPSFRRRAESRKRHYAARGWEQDWPKL